MKKLMMAAVGIATANAVALDFPAADADGHALFDTANGEYVATADMTYTQVVFGANNVLLDLSQNGGKKLSISSDVTGQAVGFTADNLSAIVKGGIWDFGGNSQLYLGQNGKYTTETLEFRGTEATNINGIVIGEAKKYCTLKLTDRAKLSAVSCRLVSSAGHHGTLDVQGGSTVRFSANFIPEEGQIGSSGYNTMRISGEESAVYVPNKGTLFGRGRSNDTVEILDGGRFEGLWLTIGGAFEKNGSIDRADNTRLVASNGTIVLTQAFTVGSSAGNSGAAFTNSTLTTGSKGDVLVGSGVNATNNWLVVSNSTIATRYLYAGYNGASSNAVKLTDVALNVDRMLVGYAGGATGNKLILSGAQGSVSQTGSSTSPFFIGNGGTNEVEFTDGFQYTITNGQIMDRSGGNRVSISNGAKVYMDSGTIAFGTGTNNNYNTLAVEPGGTLDVYRFYLFGTNNTIMVNDGTLTVRRKDVTSTTALCIGGRFNAPDRGVSNCGLVISGANATCDSVGETIFYGADGEKSYLTINLPNKAMNTVPLSGGMITFEEGTAIHVNCEDYLEYWGKDRGSVTLARASTAARLTIPASVLAAANAELPERCSLVKDGTDLVLKIANGHGFKVIVR